jgi:putative transposase
MYELHLIDKENNKKPNEHTVRNELVAHKEDWQYGLSARVLQQSVASLSKAWKNFFNTDKKVSKIKDSRKRV